MRHKSTDTMDKILKAVDDFFFTHRRSPSIMDLAKMVGCAKSTVHRYLREMHAQETLFYDGKQIETERTKKTNMNVILSPVVGSIACGAPQLEEENFEEYVELPESLFGSGEHFLLHAKGESMIEAGIDPGDLVVIRKQNTANEGDIVVALVNGETTLKRYYLDRKSRGFRLHPENKEMEDIYVKQCFIQGVAQKVIKSL